MHDWILVYTLPLVLASLLPWILGFVRLICGTVAMAAGARKIVLTSQLRVGDGLTSEPFSMSSLSPSCTCSRHLLSTWYRKN
jgi:hypothetical protein